MQAGLLGASRSDLLSLNEYHGLFVVFVHGHEQWDREYHHGSRLGFQVADGRATLRRQDSTALASEHASTWRVGEARKAQPATNHAGTYKEPF